MPTDPQANWRIPLELQGKVRMLAAQLGVKPRDIVVKALDAFFAAPVVDHAARAREQHIMAMAMMDPETSSAPLAGENGSPAAEPEIHACPECGGDLEPHPDRPNVSRCSYCGTIPQPTEDQ